MEQLMKDYSKLTLPQLLVEKKKNLAKQAELKEQSSLLDYAITAHPLVSDLNKPVCQCFSTK